MRLLTLSLDGVERVGVLESDRALLLRPGVRLLDLLGDDGGRLVEAGEAARRRPDAVVELPVGVDGSPVGPPTAPRPGGQQLRLLAPLPTPPTVRDFMAFSQHVEGVSMLMGDGRIGPEWFEIPVFYFTNPYAIVGPYDKVPIPPGCRRFDYELEVAAVIGQPGRDLTVQEAGRHIAGYTILNDWSARDLQAREMRAHLGPAKGKDTATTMGPIIVTTDELEGRRCGDSYDLGMSVQVNGRSLGADQLSSMAWSFAELVAYASRGTWVRPGDLIGSGTCGGGCLAERWGRQGADSVPPLGVGDRVTMTVDLLGTISNQVVAGVSPQLIPPRADRPGAELAGLPAGTAGMTTRSAKP
jgi:2-keto-4-pentenoate hydratase/2-oxohepta-3-ene-1,7-dioic acid hydratase in catechol pathway